MKSLPETLTRKAIRQEFIKVREATWDHFFEHEKTNGLHKHRVPGPYTLAYYSTAGITAWLITHGHYRRADFQEARSIKGNSWSGLMAPT